MSDGPRRSARLAAKKLLPKEVPPPPPAPKMRKVTAPPPRVILPHSAHTLKWVEIRRTFRRDVQLTPEHIAIEEVIREAEAIKEMCTQPTPDFPEISRRADDLWYKAIEIEWRDPCAAMFLTDTRNWAGRFRSWGGDSNALGSITSFLASVV